MIGALIIGGLAWTEHATDLAEKIFHHFQEVKVSEPVSKSASPSITSQTTSGGESPIINGDRNVVNFENESPASDRKLVEKTK
ncbi:hypothetical protein [Caballeronia sp. HLA56]